MIFWTIVFMIYWLAILVRGNIFYDTMQKNGELTLKQATTESKMEKERISKEILKNSIRMFFMIPVAIAMYVYMFKAISYDINKYPSIIMLFYSLLTTFVFKGKGKAKTDLSTEEGRVRYKIELEKIKRHSLKIFIKQLINFTYFSYMFYILVIL